MKSRKKELINRVVAIICILTLFIEIWQLLRYMVIDDVESYTRVMMHEYYSQENIDILFSGASLCYRSFNTKLLDEKLNCNTFNAGSASQNIDATYYLIKDCIKRYDVEHIYVELSPIMAQHMNIEERTPSSMTGTYIISDYMNLSFDKLSFLLNASKSEYYVDSFFVARRNWEKIFDSEYVGNLLQRKSSIEYKEYSFDYLQHEGEWYAGKGYIESNIQINNNSFCDEYGSQSIAVETINNEWFNYLENIIDYCNKNDVELTLLCAPLSEYLLVAYDSDYDNYHSAIKQIAQEAGVEFWDFSLCKESFFPASSKYYKDSSHLNMYGAEIFSNLFAQIVNGEIEYDTVVYDSVKEKLDNLPAGICGLVKENDIATIICNKQEELEYQVSYIFTDGEEMLIQDFLSNISVQLPGESKGELHIKSRDKDTADIINEVIFQ